MKKILRDTCILSALMILSVFTISLLWSGLTAEIVLVFELFGLAFLITLTDHLLDEFTSLPMITAYIVKYFLMTGIVMLFGFITGWFYPSNFWMAFIYVGIVLVLAFLLDSFRIKKDIDYINRQLAERNGKN